MRLSPNFWRSEFTCGCGCGFNTVDTALLTRLEVIREFFDTKVKVTSACRCEAHNKAVGGGKNSQHLIGRAADIQVQNVDPSLVQEFVDDMWPDDGGLGRYNTFTHIDTRTVKARWEG